MPSHAELTEHNRPIFEKIARALFIDRDLETFGGYVSDEEYIQHNPLLADGKEAVMDFLGKILERDTGGDREVKHVVVDGDIGLVHLHFTGPDGNPAVIVDMFRLRDGKLVEHWDVLQITGPLFP